MVEILIGYINKRWLGTNCDPLLAVLFLHSYDADFLQRHLKNKDRKVFVDYLHLIDPNGLKVVKDTTNTQKSETYLDLHLELDNEGRLKPNSTKTRLFQHSNSQLPLHQ